MQFHLTDGKNVHWTDERRTRLVLDVLQTRFQAKRFFRKGLTFEAEIFDMRNTVKRRHAYGQYQIVSDMDVFWENLAKEMKNFFRRADGEAKNFDYSIFEIRIGTETFFRQKFKDKNEGRIILVLAFNKVAEPKPL